jgi:type II secretory pathway pseudopilin PulG
MSDRAVTVRVGLPKGASGFTLVDVVIALAVVIIGILGVISLLLVLRSRNESLNTSRHAVRACQEMMEVVMTDKMLYPHDVWVCLWNDHRFQPRKVFVLDKESRDARLIATDDPATYVGRVVIRDVSDPEMPDSLDEVAVSVDTTGLTPSPVKASLVTRRSRK